MQRKRQCRAKGSSREAALGSHGAEVAPTNCRIGPRQKGLGLRFDVLRRGSLLQGEYGPSNAEEERRSSLLAGEK